MVSESTSGVENIQRSLARERVFVKHRLVRRVKPYLSKALRRLRVCLSASDWKVSSSKTGGCHELPARRMGD